MSLGENASVRKRDFGTDMPKQDNKAMKQGSIRAGEGEVEGRRDTRS